MDLVTPHEIFTFLEKQQISEEKATGLRLLRRAAETIAYLEDQLNESVKHPSEEETTQEQQNTINEASAEDFADPFEQFEQIALALGIASTSAEDIIDKIEEMHTEREHHIISIQQRDEIIEQGSVRGSASRGTSFHAIDRNILTDAAQFGYAVIGYAANNGLPTWITAGAQSFIDYAEQD